LVDPAASVAHILDQRARARKALPALDAVLPADPRVRDLRVTPHALDRYDELCAPPRRDEPLEKDPQRDANDGDPPDGEPTS
jgi:hypothetical protein